jgi:pyruvate/2-oxoglutarate dehydrogenase complex dihydrolipoamide acyltransferase (E2) component
MGDSITEGTVVEWTAKVGQAVQVDDVIALIETDKVTVDIKAQVSGVIVKQFVSVDQDVEVGKELYVIDTEGQVDAAAAAAATSSDGGGGEVVKGEVVEKPMQMVDHQSNDIGSGSGSGVRIPSIHFLGKKGWMEKRMVGATAASFADQQQQQQQQEEKAQVMLKPNAVTTIQADEPLPSNYGRLRLTEREMEDLGLGGAAEAPYSYK